MKHTNIPDGFPYSGETCFLEGSRNLKDYLMGGFNDESRNPYASIILDQLIKKYGIPQCGRNRATFISKKYVIKFPLNDNAESDNSFEASFLSYNTAKGKIITIKGFLCLVQERLNILSYPVDLTKLPEWVKNIDSGQVGYDFKGKLKAYDFAGIDIVKER